MGARVLVKRSSGAETPGVVVKYDAAKQFYIVNMGKDGRKAVPLAGLREDTGEAVPPPAAPPPAAPPPAAPPSKPKPSAAPLPAASPSPAKALPPPTRLPAPGATTTQADDGDDDEEEDKEEEELEPAQPAKAPSFGKPAAGPSFVGAGDGPGVLIWRVESMAPVALDKGEYGKFHTGDAYLVLKTTTTKSGGYEYDLFFWLGEKCSVDEQGAAAILARDLDDMLGGAPVQYRVVQGQEPAEFCAALGGTMSYLDGGVESGMRKVDASTVAIPTRLLHIKGLRQCRVGQVALSVASMNAGDVFVVDTGSVLYQWNGAESSIKERAKGVEVCLGLKDERVHQVELLGEVTHVQLDQGQPSEDEHPPFWAAVGGSKKDVPAAIEDSKEDDKKAASDTMLYRIKEGEKNGKRILTTEKLKSVSRSLLDADDTFILVCPAEIYAWIGKEASDAERKNAMIKAQQFIRTANKPNWTPITRVIQGAEPQLFKSKFSDWSMAESTGKPSLEMFAMAKGSASGRNVAKNIHEDKPADIARKVMVADPKQLKKRSEEEQERKRKGLVPGGKGQLSIWRIWNFRKVPLEPELYGLFFAGDCYIVCFKFERWGKEEVLLYHWHGRLSSADERGSAALLVRTMDDEDFGGNAIQERVVQNNEPEEFIALFGGKLVVRDGGLTKTGVDTRDHDGISLFQVKGQSALTVRAVQVVESATSLNSGDCFVLERPGHIHVWQGKLCSADEQKTSAIVGETIATRLAFVAAKPDGGAAAVAAAAAAAQAAVVGIDEDGDGVPDMAVPLVMALSAGGAMPGGSHVEKLGVYLPQQDTTNDRPFYAHESNPGLLMWWAKDRWWIGKRDELGRNRGWLKVKCKEFTPPASGWIVYATKEKSWREATEMSCTNAERIVLGGSTPDGAHAEKVGEFCKTSEEVNGRPVYCRETRPNLMLWWSGGRWWLGKRDELGTHRGWIKVHSEAATPLEVSGGWLVYSSSVKKWLQGDQLWCKVNDEFVPKAEAAPTGAVGDAAAEDRVKHWDVSVCAEGSEPAEFWGALGGKKPYADHAPVAASHEPRLFYCSDETGAFKVEEVLDFSQEDLEHDDVFILDCYDRVYVWIGAESDNEREARLSMESAACFIEQQAKLDGRPTSQKPLQIKDGEEPLDFTKEFVGWSNNYGAKWEDPYDKRLRLERERKQQELDEAAETIFDEPSGGGGHAGPAPIKSADGRSVDAAWGKGGETPATRLGSSIPIKNIIKLTMERNGGKAPPVAALSNGEIILRNAKQVQIPGAKVSMPKLALGQVPSIHEASTLDSARRRASAAAKAAGGDSEQYADPETERFSLKVIQADSAGNNAGKALNPMCRELYLNDAEFIVTFGMDKDQFWKQPFWKQRDAKRKNKLF